jgi:hypothetical protein
LLHHRCVVLLVVVGIHRARWRLVAIAAVCAFVALTTLAAWATLALALATTFACLTWLGPVVAGIRRCCLVVLAGDILRCAIDVAVAIATICAVAPISTAVTTFCTIAAFTTTTPSAARRTVRPRLVAGVVVGSGWLALLRRAGVRRQWHAIGIGALALAGTFATSAATTATP